MGAKPPDRGTGASRDNITRDTPSDGNAEVAPGAAPPHSSSGGRRGPRTGRGERTKWFYDTIGVNANTICIATEIGSQAQLSAAITTEARSATSAGSPAAADPTQAPTTAQLQ